MTYARKSTFKVVLKLIAFIAMVVVFGFLLMQNAKQHNAVIQNEKNIGYEKDKKFIVQNDCWMVLLVKHNTRGQRWNSYHYQCLKQPHQYTYRSQFYYPEHDYFNPKSGLSESQRMQVQLSVNRAMKPNFIQNAY